MLLYQDLEVLVEKPKREPAHENALLVPCSVGELDVKKLGDFCSLIKVRLRDA
jgi:hypothetical protein